jgi:putative transposase
MDRDENAARNILSRGLGTVGHIRTSALDVGNACGDETSTLVGESVGGVGFRPVKLTNP